MEESVFIPKVKTIQRMALYETKSKFYLVGSNNTQTLFRLNITLGCRSYHHSWNARFEGELKNIGFVFSLFVQFNSTENKTFFWKTEE